MSTLQPLTIYCYVDKASKYKDLEKLKKELNRHYPVNLILEEFDGSTAEWVKRIGKDGKNKYYLTDSFNNKLSHSVAQKWGNEIDVVGVFIAPENWKNGEKRLLGTQFGKSHYDYYVFSCKLHSKYDGTGEHELLHAIDNYVLKYAKVLLEKLFNVESFDNDVVHAKEYWKKGYFYDTVWKKLKKILSVAISNKRAMVTKFPVQKQKVEEIPIEKSESIPEIIETLLYRPKNFALHELVSEKVYKEKGEKAWEFFDERILQNLQAIRDHYGVAVHVNNWKQGGQFSYRGFDEGGYRKNGYSQHNMGRAIDFTVSGKTAQQVRDDIVNGAVKLPHKNIWLEDDVSWLHMDVRYSGFDGVYLFKV